MSLDSVENAEPPLLEFVSATLSNDHLIVFAMHAGPHLMVLRAPRYLAIKFAWDILAEIDEVFPVNARDGDEEFPFATCVVRNAVRALRETVVD
jgi:hypothetical protein